MVALKEYGIDSEVVFAERGPGENIFEGLPYSFVHSGGEFQRKLLCGNYDYLSFIYSLDYLNMVPRHYPAKIIYEVRGWNRKIEEAIEGLEPVDRLDGIVCIASYLKDLVRQKLARHIPVYVDGNTVHPMFKPLHHPYDVWKACPLARPGRKAVVFVGRLERSKNWRQFLEICAEVAKQEPIEVWIVCNCQNTSEMERMKRRVVELGLPGVTRIIPEVPNDRMPAVYAAARRSGGLLLSSSLREGLGNHVLEPLACELPVVSSDVPGKNEIIRHRRNGMLYPSDAPGRAVRYVLELLRDSSLREKLRAGGRLTIRTTYTKVRYVSRYKTILARL